MTERTEPRRETRLSACSSSCLSTEGRRWRVFLHRRSPNQQPDSASLYHSPTRPSQGSHQLFRNCWRTNVLLYVSLSNSACSKYPAFSFRWDSQLLSQMVATPWTASRPTQCERRGPVVLDWMTRLSAAGRHWSRRRVARHWLPMQMSLAVPRQSRTRVRPRPRHPRANETRSTLSCTRSERRRHSCCADRCTSCGYLHICDTGRLAFPAGR